MRSKIKIFCGFIETLIFIESYGLIYVVNKQINKHSQSHT